MNNDNTKNTNFAAAQPAIETRLSDRDRDIFLALLNSDEEPNEALKQAVEEYKKGIREGTLISEND